MLEQAAGGSPVCSGRLLLFPGDEARHTARSRRPPCRAACLLLLVLLRQLLRMAVLLTHIAVQLLVRRLLQLVLRCCGRPSWRLPHSLLLLQVDGWVPLCCRVIVCGSMIWRVRITLLEAGWHCTAGVRHPELHLCLRCDAAAEWTEVDIPSLCIRDALAQTD